VVGGEFVVDVVWWVGWWGRGIVRTHSLISRQTGLGFYADRLPAFNHYHIHHHPDIWHAFS
jgi:hypothetical protein